MIFFLREKACFYTFSVIFPCNLFESNVKFSVIFQLSCPCTITVQTNNLNIPMAAYTRSENQYNTATNYFLFQQVLGENIRFLIKASVTEYSHPSTMIRHQVMHDIERHEVEDDATQFQMV